MQKISNQDLKYAKEYRDEIHQKALILVKYVCPEANCIIDKYSPEDYFQEYLDYPGEWYKMVGVPQGIKSKNELIRIIVKETIEYYKSIGAFFSDENFYKLLKEYPEIVIDYYILNKDNKSAKKNNVFLCSGKDSHFLALKCAANDIFKKRFSYDLKKAKCKKLRNKALIAPINSDNWLNYRQAFLCPPHHNSYTNEDFDRINDVLFPCGIEYLEVYKWSTDWSNYFDEGNEWWGSLCLTVYDNVLERFTIIMASATD